MIPAIILSAGESKRMGFPKPLLRLRSGRTLLEDQIERLQKAGCRPIAVVLGADAEKIISNIVLDSASLRSNSKYLILRASPATWRGESRSRRFHVVINKNWHLGQFSSTKAGLKSLKNRSQGCLILPIDVPFIPVKLIKRVLTHALTNKTSDAIIPACKPTHKRTNAQTHQKGHPIWISEQLIKKALRMNTKTGRLDRMIEASENIHLLKTSSPTILNNMNTPKEWKALASPLMTSENA